MKRHLYIILALLIVSLTASCESYLIHDELDGFWQVQSIENKQDGNITHCNGDIYYSFQRDLVLVSYVSPTIPQGQIKENHIAYFTYENDTISMTDFRVYIDKDATPSLLSKLEKFGLYETYNKFQVEELRKNHLVLNSEKARIVMLRY